MSNDEALPLATNSVPLLSTERLSVFYDAFQAVHEVDLCVNAGEIVSIIGANGAGKSTLLKAIIGQAERIEGRIQFAGRDLTGLPNAAHCRRRYCHGAGG